jgi:hypothetical protein
VTLVIARPARQRAVFRDAMTAVLFFHEMINSRKTIRFPVSAEK